MDTWSPPTVARVLWEVVAVAGVALVTSAAALGWALPADAPLWLVLVTALPPCVYASVWAVRHRHELRVEPPGPPLAGLGWANRVTLLRLFWTAPAALGVILLPLDAPQPRRLVLAALLCLVLLCDALDGWLARRLKQVTRFGLFLDPSADFYANLVIGTCVALSGLVPVWFVGFILWRVLALTIGGFIVLRRTGLDRTSLIVTPLGRAAVVSIFVCLALGVLLWVLDLRASFAPALLAVCALAGAVVVADLVQKTVLLRRLLSGPPTSQRP